MGEGPELGRAAPREKKADEGEGRGGGSEEKRAPGYPPGEARVAEGGGLRNSASLYSKNLEDLRIWVGGPLKCRFKWPFPHF